MNRKYSLLLVLITAIFELAFLVWTRADNRSTNLNEEEYEVPAENEIQGDIYDRSGKEIVNRNRGKRFTW